MGKASRVKRGIYYQRAEEEGGETYGGLMCCPMQLEQLIRHFDGCKADLVCDGAPNDRRNERLEGPNKVCIPFQAVWGFCTVFIHFLRQLMEEPNEDIEGGSLLGFLTPKLV